MAQFLKEQDILDRISQPGGAFTVKQAEALRKIFIAVLDEVEAAAEAIEDLEGRVDELEPEGEE